MSATFEEEVVSAVESIFDCITSISKIIDPEFNEMPDEQKKLDEYLEKLEETFQELETKL